MKHITKKRVSRGRKRGQVRTQARPRKRASVTRHRKKNKSRRGFYTKKRKVMAGGVKPGGVKPEGWDKKSFYDQMVHNYDESKWRNLDDETKIEFINKIPNDYSLSLRLDSLSYTSNSQAVKDAIANRMSSAGPAVAPEGSHRLSPTSSPRLRSSLPDFASVALNARNAYSADLSRHPSSPAVSSRGSFGEHPFQPHPFQRSARTPLQFLDPQGSSQPVDPVVVSLPTSPRPYLEPPETSSSSLQQPDTLTMRYQPPSTSPPGSIHSLASHEPVSARTQEPVLLSESRATQQQLPPSRPPPPPPPSESSSSPSESIPPPPPSQSPPPPSQLPPTNQEPVLSPPNLLGNLPPVQNEQNTHDVPIPPILLEELKKKEKTNNSGNNNSRTVICDCTRSSTPPTPTSSRFSRAKDMANNWFNSRNKVSITPTPTPISPPPPPPPSRFSPAQNIATKLV